MLTCWYEATAYVWQEAARSEKTERERKKSARRVEQEKEKLDQK